MLKLHIPLIASLLLLNACGFSPLHGHKSTTPQLRQVEVAPIGGREGQLLISALEDRLHPGDTSGAPHLYRLQATITVTPQAAGVEIDREITRYNLHLVSSFHLTRISDGREIYSGRLRRISSYNVSDSDFSTFVSRRDALKRGIDELAEDYHMRLAAFFARSPAL